MNEFERLGAFYLGKTYDAEASAVNEDLLLYDAKDLTTHGVCVGMTGSGKTGLCLALLEEAAIDGIPTIAIDPKGDLGNLALAFPDLRPADFESWIDEAEARRKGEATAERAKKIAARWKSGIESWGQSKDRIRRFRDACDVAIYTPGSGAGLPLGILKGFAAPPPELVANGDAFRARTASAVSGLLALVGLDADPVKSRDHILLSSILDDRWRAGLDVDLPSLIRDVQSPPLERVGVFDLETFYPATERFGLAMMLNNLVASPSFAAWTEGEPLDIDRLLWTTDGTPRISIISIAHLSDAERMFVVTAILDEVLAWVRRQSGTATLRALLYMDEVFGFFPPTANPPSKTPMLTLLKQARAFGLGVLLATQNPVDLDYKGLANTGTWFLGRLQTERDKKRVMDGLEGAAAATGASFDRSEIDALLSGLESRVFLMNNVHDDEPVLFHTRWVLSYLRGPLQSGEITRLMGPRRAAALTEAARASTPGASRRRKKPARKRTGSTPSSRPVLPPEVPEFFLPAVETPSAEERLLYRPALTGAVRLHFVDARRGLDEWRRLSLIAPIEGDDSDGIWDDADLIAGSLDLRDDISSAADFETPPAAATNVRQYRTWTKELKEFAYRSQWVPLFSSRFPKASSRPGESEGQFRARLREMLREERDAAIEKLRDRYAAKVATAKERIRKARERLDREKAQYSQQKYQTALSFGATVLGALFGRKVASRTNIGRATTAARGAGRAAKERGDVSRAVADVEAREEKLEALEEKLREELEELREEYDPDEIDIATKNVRPRKSDIAIHHVALVWTPWIVRRSGVADPAYTVRSSGIERS